MAAPGGKRIYDDALLGIISNEGQILPFLDVIFGFLYRRTDFFKPLTKGQNIGFAPGVAKNMVFSVFSAYEALSLKENKSNLESHDREGQQIEHVTNKSEVTSPKERNICKHKGQSNQKKPLNNNDNCHKESIGQSLKNTEQPDENFSNSNQDDLQKWFQSRPESYNGAVRETYAWSQSIGEVDVRVPVPGRVLKGRQVDVCVRPKHLRVALTPDGDIPEEVLVDDDLSWPVRETEMIWSLEPGRAVMVSLEKVQERWWQGLFQGEPKIDLRKIDCSRPVTDLEEEAQAKLDQVMYDQKQKMLGKPTSDQQKMERLLKEAWDVEGSPFKGTPFDPTVLNVQGNNLTLPGAAGAHPTEGPPEFLTSEGPPE